VKSRRTRDGADGVAGKIEFGEGVEAEHPGAVDRIADRIVLFENEDREPFRGKPGGRCQTGRPGADNDDIPATG
jgi:hypothetical protein